MRSVVWKRFSAAILFGLSVGTVGAASDWTWYAADEAANPRPGVACLSNATWVVAARLQNAEKRTLCITTNGYENAYLNSVDNADVLDLRGTITDTAGNAYTITHIDRYALGADSQKSTAKAFVAPTTLDGGLHGWFNGWTKDKSGQSISEQTANYTNIVIHVPDKFETIDGGQVPVTAHPLNWDLVLPNLQTISGGALTAAGTKNATIAMQTGVFKTNSFLSVKTIGDNALSNKGFSGRLHLPQIVSINNWGVNGNSHRDGFTDVELSPTAKTLKRLGDGCLGWSPNLTNVVIGLASDNTISHQIFNGCAKLTRVEFTGAPPKFANNAGYEVFNAAEFATTFIVPARDEWAAWLKPFEASGDFVRFSDAEILAYHSEHPGLPVRIGTVSTNVFRSAHAQYVALAYDMAAVDEWVTYDSFFGDSVEIASSEFTPVDGKLPLGSPYSATLVAKPNAERGGTFLGWYGDVPGGKDTNTTVTVSLAYKAGGRRPWVFARFAHPWTVTVDGNNALLDNGQFRLQATVVNSDKRTLQLGRTGAGSFYAPDNTGDGVCDLGGTVTDAAGTAWTFSAISGNSGVFSSVTNNTVPGASTLVTPGTLTSWPNVQNFHATNRRATYENIVIDEPTADGGFMGWQFSGQKRLRRFIVRAPKFNFSDRLEGTFYGTQIADTDLGWWRLDGMKQFSSPATVQNLIGNGLNWSGDSWSTVRCCYGMLTLPSISTIGPFVFDGAKGLSALALGTGDRNSRVTAIGEKAFRNCSGITNIVVNAAADWTVGTNAFVGASGLKTVTYLGPVVNEAAFGNLLAGVAASDTDKPVRVYVSSFQGWEAAPYISDVAESEKPYLPAGERVIGVYRAGAAEPNGKAWICHRSSPFDPDGTLLIFR